MAGGACRVCGRALPTTTTTTTSTSTSTSTTCSRACAAAGLDDDDDALERAIAALLGARARGATICPSEACRAVFGDVDAAHLERARRAARRLVARGAIEITQRGVVVDPSRARGPIRLRRVEAVPVVEVHPRGRARTRPT